MLPPFLRDGILCHFRHIRIIVLTNILKICKHKVTVAENRIIAEITIRDRFQNTGSGLRVECTVLIDFVLFQLPDLTKTDHNNHSF